MRWFGGFWLALVVILVVGPLLAACQPQVVRETVVVEKEVEKVVKETEVVEKVVEIQVTPTPEQELEGTIVISVQGNDTQTWENVALAYAALNPKVDVRVELKPEEGYQEWIRAQFATGDSGVSLVNANVVNDLIQAEKFVDLVPYLDKVSPYSGVPWRDDIQAQHLSQMIDPVKNNMYVLNLETVQVMWFYNKSIFEEAGITDVPNQPTWDQFVEWGEKIKDAGYIPVAVEGDFNSFWAMRVGWMARMYTDQYTRHEEPDIHCQPGDWCFREGIDDVWEYDPSDPFNDSRISATFNSARALRAFHEGQQRVDTPEFKAMYENLARVLGPMTQPGWIGTVDALPLFLTQKAAMWLDGGWFFTQFEKQIRQLAEGTYGVKEGEPTPTPIAGAERAEAFELGTFNVPSMEGEYVDAPARTMEGTVGFWGIPKKGQKQNDLEVDFLMFLTSPSGAALYLRNKLDPNNLHGGVSGPLVVTSVDLPEPWKTRFANVKLIGAADGPAGYRARGLHDYQPMVREWADLAQSYFEGQITVDEFLTSYQTAMEGLFEEMLTEHLLWAEGLAALDHPEKEPEKKN